MRRGEKEEHARCIGALSKTERKRLNELASIVCSLSLCVQLSKQELLFCSLCYFSIIRLSKAELGNALITGVRKVLLYARMQRKALLQAPTCSARTDGVGMIRPNRFRVTWQETWRGEARYIFWLSGYNCLRWSAAMNRIVKLDVFLEMC